MYVCLIICSIIANKGLSQVYMKQCGHATVNYVEQTMHTYTAQFTTNLIKEQGKGIALINVHVQVTK